jgi:hypothetical protein
MFLLTMTTRSLPFTYKDNEAARQYRAKHKDTLGVAAGATNFGGGEPEPPQPEAEATRLAADKVQYVNRCVHASFSNYLA